MGSYCILKTLTVTAVLVCVESVVFQSNDEPDRPPIKDATFTSVIEMKNYLFAHGVPEDKFLDVVVNNNWELENLCRETEPVNDDFTRIEFDEDADHINADKPENHDNKQHGDSDRQRRSTPASSCQGQCERSLCPWNYSFNIDWSRTPHAISYAVCRSRTCSFAFAGLRQLDQLRLETDTFCDVIRQDIRVMKAGVQTMHAWPVACMCSKHGHVLSFNKHVLGSSGPTHVEHSITGQGQFTPEDADNILSTQRDQSVHVQDNLVSFSDGHQPQSSHERQHHYHPFWRMLQQQGTIADLQSPTQRRLGHKPKQQYEETVYENEHSTRLPKKQEDNETYHLVGRAGDEDGVGMEYAESQAHLRKPHTTHQLADKLEQRINVLKTSENTRGRRREGGGRHRNGHRNGLTKDKAKLKRHGKKHRKPRKTRLRDFE